MPRELKQEGVYKKQGSKCYHMCIRVDDATVVNRTTGMRTKRAASQVYWETRERLVKAVLCIHSDKTPRDILPLWRRMADVKFGPKYIAAVDDSLERHWRSLMDKPVVRITQEEVQAIEVQIRECGFLPESINKAINAFSCLITFARTKLKWFRYVEFSFSREKVERTTKDVIGKKHLVGFLACIASQGNIQVLLIIAMMLGLGLRECEALSACWSGFLLGPDGQLAFRTKAKRKVRVVPVPEWLELMIRHYEESVLDPNFRPSRRGGRPRGCQTSTTRSSSGTKSTSERNWMFSGASGEPHSAGYSSTYIKFACEKLGLPSLSPHRMRGSSANMLKIEGLSLDEIQKILGHSSIVTTALYLTQNHAITRDVQNVLGRQVFPGADSALAAFRESASRRTTRRLLPMPTQAVDQIAEDVIATDSPAMRFLPPLKPELAIPVEIPPLETQVDKGTLVAAVDRMTMARRPSRPAKDLLQKLVWMVPTSTLAEVFGVSDVAIGKWCAELGIPKPGRGFWAKALPLLEGMKDVCLKVDT